MRLVDVDPWTGVREYVSYNENDDALTIHRVQDVEPILDRAKAMANDGSHWRNQAKNDELGIDMRYAAIIPVMVQEEWLRKYGVRFWETEHWPKVRALLNGEYKGLKTADVTI